ncbi:MAG: type II toxin-antitoxin system VapC family toxin [Acidobacteriia bacterium]|nr:type II toxin-antitoxin system VapC family toxin [Terriglobia bacterium]
MSFLPITVRHAARELDTPPEHRDPFDELLLVQAQEEGLKLLTTDQQMAGHPVTVTTI